MRHALIVGSSGEIITEFCNTQKGITGYPLSRHFLVKDEWKVSGITRKQYSFAPQGLNLVHTDLLDQSALEKALEHGILDTVTHVYFTAWILRGSEEKDVEDNTQMIENLLNALEARKCNIEFIYLQTGTKYYGMDVGQSRGMKAAPWKEESQRLDSNMFYYPIEDLIAKRALKQRFHYVIGRPPCIIGFTANNAMESWKIDFSNFLRTLETH